MRLELDTSIITHLPSAAVYYDIYREVLSIYTGSAMLLGTVQITGEELREAEVKDICNSLKDNSIRLLSLRGCHIQDEDFKKLMDSLKDNESLVQLNLNLGVCNGKHRIKWLTEAMMLNKSLGSLL